MLTDDPDLRAFALAIEDDVRGNRSSRRWAPLVRMSRDAARTR